MVALLAAPMFVFVILVVLGLAATGGVDSRDGFADDRFPQAYR